MALTTDQLIDTYNKTKRKFGNLTIIKAGTRGFYDVFEDNGWYNHTRIFFNRKDKTISIIIGKNNPTLLKEIEKCIHQLVK